MKLLIFGDVQLHSYKDFSFINSEGYNNRAYNLMKGLTDIINSQSDLDAVVVCGDFFHNRASIDVDVISLAHKFIKDWSQKTNVVFLAGNHDQFLLNGNITSLSQFSNVPNCIVVEKPTCLMLGNEYVHFSPFDEKVENIVNGIKNLQNEHSSKYLIGHWTIKGSNTGVFTIEEGVEKDEAVLSNYSNVILGDIHLHQRIGKNIMYVGSPCQHDFGERGSEKFVWLLDSEKGLQAIKTNFPKFVKVLTLEEAKNQKEKGNYVEYESKSLESTKKASLIKGIKIDNTWNTSISSEERPVLQNIEESIELYCKSHKRDDLIEFGKFFLKDLISERTVPQNFIKFRTLKAKDFFSYENLEIDFSKNHGFVIINGIVENGIGVDSNGAGKTTVYEALLFALYGYTLRYKISKDFTVREGCKNNSVTLEFEIDKDKDSIYKIERSKSKLRFFKNKDELTRGTSKDTQALINSYIGNLEFFIRISFLALHYNPSFLSLDDSEKKAFIDKFCGLDMFDVAKENVTKQLDEVTSKIQELLTKKNLTESKRKYIDDNINNAHKVIQNFETQEDEKEAKRNLEIKNLETEIEKISLKELPVLDSSHEEELEKLNSEIDEYETLIKETDRDFLSKKIPLQSKIEELKKISNGAFKKGYTCPYCGYVFTGEEDIVLVINNAKTEIESLQKKISDLEFEFNPLLKKADDIKKEIVQKRNNKLSEIEKIKKQIQDTKLYNQSQSSLISSKQQKIEFLRSIKRGLPTALLESLSLYKEQKKTLTEEIQSIDKELISYKDTEGKLEFWKIGFGSKGCKSLMYTSIFDRINIHLQSFCNKLSGGLLTASLSPVMEGKEKTQERINLKISNLSGSNVFNGDSIGERTRIDIAVNLSLRKALLEISNYGLNMFFIDEPWLGLDESGKKTLYELIELESKTVGNLFVTDQDFSSKGSVNCSIWTARKSLINNNYISSLEHSVN